MTLKNWTQRHQERLFLDWSVTSLSLVSYNSSTTSIVVLQGRVLPHTLPDDSSCDSLYNSLVTAYLTHSQMTNDSANWKTSNTNFSSLTPLGASGLRVSSYNYSQGSSSLTSGSQNQKRGSSSSPRGEAAPSRGHRRRAGETQSWEDDCEGETDFMIPLIFREAGEHKGCLPPSIILQGKFLLL